MRSDPVGLPPCVIRGGVVPSSEVSLYDVNSLGDSICEQLRRDSLDVHRQARVLVLRGLRGEEVLGSVS